VADGNYSASQDVVFDQIETLIVLALPWRVMFWRTFKRTMGRMLTREVLWNGNRESFRMSFLSRDSVLYDLYRRRRHFENIADEVRAAAPDRIRLVVIESTRQLRDFYAGLGLIRR